MNISPEKHVDTIFEPEGHIREYYQELLETALEDTLPSDKDGNPIDEDLGETVHNFLEEARLLYGVDAACWMAEGLISELEGSLNTVERVSDPILGSSYSVFKYPQRSNAYDAAKTFLKEHV